jgi:hypothetical protein
VEQRSSVESTLLVTSFHFPLFLFYIFSFLFAFTLIICLHYIVYEHLGKERKRKIRDF